MAVKVLDKPGYVLFSELIHSQGIISPFPYCYISQKPLSTNHILILSDFTPKKIQNVIFAQWVSELAWKVTPGYET